MKKLVYILIGVLLIACSDSDKPSKPDNLIAKEQMSDIIYDVFLLNAAKGINKIVLEKNGILPQEYVFKKYNIDSLQFAMSNDYYAYDTETYQGIIEKVKLKIEFEKKKNDSINLKEEKVKDSLRIAKSKEKDTLRQIKMLKKESDTLLKLKPQHKPKVFGQDQD